MSRRRTPLFRDEVQQGVARLRTLLGMIEAAASIEYDSAERGGFSTAPRPPADRFLGRRILAMVEEREARRIARKQPESR